MKTTCGKVTAFLFALFLMCLSQASLASPGDLISLDPSTCGAWSGGKHCWREQNIQGITNVDFIVSFDKPVAFGDGNTYVVPIMTLMSITNFVSYINVCVDGASAPDSVLPADILVDGKKAGDNYVKTNVESCHGGTVWKGNQGPIKYLFSEQGLHHVQIVVASQNNGTCGIVSREFDVIVVHPVLSVNGSASRIISFGRNEAEKTFNIIWTIKNLGGFASTLETVTATGCGENLECNFIAFGPLDINPNESIIVVEEVKAKKPAAITAPVAVEELGIELGYIDLFGLSRLNKQSSLPVNVALLWNEEQRFHVELVGGQQNYCIGQDGKLGGTGPGEVPHVLFNWAWSSIGINEPGTYSCDKKSSNDLEYIYCDPTQFSIELLKRLNMINTAAAQEGKSGKAAELSHFQAYLIGDSINADFRKDFDYYYKTTEFFGADWYNSPDSPWDLYFTDTQRMVFSPEKIDSGLYDVELDFDFESGNYKFFWSENELAAKITVRLTKISGPLFQNPLYYLPFNGEVGLQRIDEDGLARRNGYGLGFSGDELRLDEFRLGSFILTKGEGEKTVQTAYVQDFYKSNISEKGLILSIAKDGSSIVFSPSYATPIIMELKANEATGRADGYYSVHDGAKTMVSPSGYMNLWTGFASTPMTCANFDESSLYYQRNDGAASEVPGLETTPENQAYGFTWKDIPAQNLQQGKLYLETVFYTPIDSGMTLSGESTTLMSPSGTGQAVSLNYKGMSPIIESVFSLVNGQYVCVSLSDSALEFWWNPQRVTKDLDGIKAAQISEAWMSGCSVEGEAK